MLPITAAAATTPREASATPQPRLVRAAHEFEAQMMKELLKPMTANLDGNDGEDSDSSYGSASALTEFASEALGEALSEQGGFGIADSIVQRLSPASHKPANMRAAKRIYGHSIVVPRMTKVISVQADKSGKEQ